MMQGPGTSTSQCFSSSVKHCCLQNRRNAIPMCSVTSSIPLGRAQRARTWQRFPQPALPEATQGRGESPGFPRAKWLSCGPGSATHYLGLFETSHFIFLSHSFFICIMGLTFCPLKLCHGWKKNQVCEGASTQQVLHTAPYLAWQTPDFLQHLLSSDICV